MLEIIEFALSGFWKFIGFIIILTTILHYTANLILQIIHKSIRARTIRKMGYPPDHCDGDGDLRKEVVTNEI